MTDEELIQKWIVEIYDNEDVMQISENLDYNSLAIGFFMALGKSYEQAEDLYRICIQRNVF